jgi:hypothetical protein
MLVVSSGDVRQNYLHVPVSRWNALSVLFLVRCAVTSFFKIPSYKCQRGKTQYATHTATTLSKTYKMDKDKAGHYDQTYKYGHIGQTVHLYNKKGRETWWNMQQKIMTYNWILSGHFTIKSLSFHTQSRKVNTLTLFTYTIPVNTAVQLLHCHRTIQQVLLIHLYMYKNN